MREMILEYDGFVCFTWYRASQKEISHHGPAKGLLRPGLIGLRSGTALSGLTWALPTVAKWEGFY